MNIEGKNAIVTGAGSGLGAAISTALVQAGARVFGLARNEKALAAMQQSLGNTFVPVVMDICNEQAVHQWFAQQFASGYGADILINNAGVGAFAPIDELPSAQWHQIINTNLNGLYYLSSVVAHAMKANGVKGHIINIGSIIGKVGRAESTAYSSSKFAVQGFSESLMLELRPFGIKVSCVNPGSIETAFFNNSNISTHSNMLQPEDIAQSIIHLLQTPDNMLISEMLIRPLNPNAPE